MADEANVPAPAQAPPEAGVVQTPPPGTPPAAPIADPKPTAETAPPAGEAAPKNLINDGPAADVPETPKPPEPAAQTALVPQKYELKLPENSLLKAQALDEIAQVAKAHKLTQEQAQALVQRESQSLASYHQAQLDDLKAKSQVWIQDVKADTEIGGQAFVKSAELASRVVKRFGTPTFQQMINASGAGNHPELVRIFARIGRAMSEDQLVMPGSASSGAERSMEEIFYGKAESQK